MSTCAQDVLDLRGINLPIIMNQVDTFHISLAFKDDAGLPRDMSLAVIYLVINDVTVAELGTGITVGGVGNNEVSVSYGLVQPVGVHQYQLRVIDSGVDRAELYGKLTIKDI